MESLKIAFEVITSPFNGFKRLKEKKTFWAAFLLTVIISTGAIGYYSFNVDMKYVITQQLERSGKMDNIPKKQMNKIIDLQAKTGKYFMTGGAVIGSFIYLFIIALYLFTMGKIFTSDLTFKDALVIVGNSYFVFFISSLILLIIMFATDFKTSLIQDLMPGNLAYYFSVESVGKKLYTLFSKIDVFSLWFVSLLGIGFHIFTEESLIKSILTVFVPYILLIAFAVFMA